MMKQSKWQLLVGLLLVWGVIVFVQFLEDPEQSNMSSKNSGSLNGSDTLVDTVPGSLTLAKTFHNPRQQTTLSKPRNIFQPLGAKPVVHKSPPTTQRKTAQTQPSSPPKAVAPPGPSPLELATQRAQQQLQQYRFLGYLKKGGESQAFLTKGQAIYIVKQGATVEGRIQVSRINPTMIVLSTQILESSDPIEAEIPLTKEQKNS